VVKIVTVAPNWPAVRATGWEALSHDWKPCFRASIICFGVPTAFRDVNKLSRLSPDNQPLIGQDK
jgi:hypothetical protein